MTKLPLAPSKKEGPREAGLELDSPGQCRSGGLAVDLGEVVLSGLRAIGRELAQIFGGRLRPRDESLAARTDQLGLDLERLADGLGGGQLVETFEEGFGVLVHRLLDVAADLGR